MAQVTLRDLATNEDIVVPPEGFIFGRVGGDADIQIEDNSISRRQARVSLKGGQWLLETLAVPQGQKAPRPIGLQEGATFNVGQSEFEVVQIEEDEEEQEAAKTVMPPAVKGKPAAPQASAAKKAPAAPNAKTTPSQSQQKRPAAARDDAGGGGDEIAQKGFGAMFVAVPKGLAYYLVNVPKMLVNPMGTVKKTIEELPAEPMGRIELIGYALPSLLATALLGAWAGGLAALIGPGHVFSIMSFIPIGPAIGSVIGAIVTGFIFHPVLTWVIKKLKGESDARSRTNYFLQMQVVAIVLAVPSALGTILAALPVPFIGLVGLLLGVVASLVNIYVLFQWFTFFKVVKWFKTVLLVLGGLVLLSAAWGLIQGVISTVKGLGSGGGAAVVATNDGSGDSADSADDATAGLDEMPTDPEEAKAWAEKRTKQLQAKAAADLKKAQAAAAKDAPKDEGDSEPTEPKEPKKDTKTAAKDEPKPAKDEPKPAKDEPRDEPVAAKDTPPPPAKVDVAPITASGAYGTFARRRDSIEKTFEADPTILAKSTELQKLYSEYLDAAYDLDKKLQKDNQKKPELSKLNARLHDAELFTKTSKTIDQLAEKMKIK